MKKTILLLSLAILTAATCFAQKADDICGIYFSRDPFTKTGSQCKVYKAADGTYEAKVVWIENTKKADKSMIGLVFMHGLKYNATENEYQNGRIQYPGKKGTFKTYVRMANNNKTMKLRGYLGISLFGMTVDWTRESKIRVQE